VKRWQILGVIVVSHQAYAADVQACGPTPPILTAQLPLADARGVPLDAALITSTNWGLTTSTLRKVDADEAGGMTADAGVDGGQPNIELSRVCYETPERGSVCVAKPARELEPETTYEWSAALDPRAGIDPDYVGPTALRRFTTSRARHTESETALDVKVLTHDAHTAAPCGPTVSANLRIDAALSSPVVVNVAGFTPSYVMDARVLTPQAPSLEFLLYGPPDCITLEAFDVTGVRTELNTLCLEHELPLATVDEQNQPVEPIEPQPNAPSNDASQDEQTPQEGVALDAVEEPEKSGCQLGRSHSSSSVWALGAMAAVLLFMRRRNADLPRTQR
jgi:hypothetical protein